jgi:hypothetical protein
MCVNCGEPAQDAHHILERRLFDDGGYYLDNGASVCGECHILAEQTVLTAQMLREKIGIEEPILPEHFYSDIEYDKWGNPYTNNFGNRLKGDLFYDESVQKILKAGDQLQYFSKYVKYPRTFFVPWGDKTTKDDKVLKDDRNFVGQEVVVTVKMDGENTTMYNDFIHARSINSGNHPTRSKVKELWAQQICWQLSNDERICGENLYAKHSIHYTDLPSYFMVFSWWENNVCLSWEETEFNCEVLGLETVPVMYKGIYSPRIIQEMYEQEWKGKNCEGYVIRLAKEFTYGGFRKSIMKYVDPIFRQQVNESHGHWISKKITPNEVV